MTGAAAGGGRYHPAAAMVCCGEGGEGGLFIRARLFVPFHNLVQSKHTGTVNKSREFMRNQCKKMQSNNEHFFSFDL
jgi:hypothetical protein